MPSLSALPLRCTDRRAAGSAPGRRQRRQLARGDHLGEHHRRRLQRLDFLLRIGAPGAVLHHQHAKCVAGAQYRHAEEGVVDLFAGFRPEGEGRMRLRVRQIDGARLARDQSDQALVGAHHGTVHGVAIEALGGVKFEGGIDAQHIDGADLRNHVGGDQHHDLVEAFLRADRLRHDFAESAQQHARTAERATHGVRSLGRYCDRCDSPRRAGLIRRGIRRGPARGDHPEGYIECGMQTASQRQRYDGGRAFLCAAALCIAASAHCGLLLERFLGRYGDARSRP